jgi:predicted molibdopterin-dependent oxidoreductase YjgC
MLVCLVEIEGMLVCLTIVAEGVVVVVNMTKVKVKMVLWVLKTVLGHKGLPS